MRRSVEDLKDRYYSICRRLLVAREGGEAAVCNQLMIKYPYNAQHERDRKRAFHTLLTRSFAQVGAGCWLAGWLAGRWDG